MMLLVHAPGSAEAVYHGCTCRPQDGPGAALSLGGQPAYLCDTRCPLHGIDAAEPTFASETWRIGSPANDNE